MEIAILACVFYYMCCVGVPTVSGKREKEKTDQTIPELEFSKVKTANYHFRRSLSSNNLPVNSSSITISEQSKENFISTHQLEGNDIEILEYLAEVVKEQQTFEVYGLPSVIAPIRLDHTPCQTFQSKSQKKASFFGFKK